jgi:hypothetical protein
VGQISVWLMDQKKLPVHGGGGGGVEKREKKISAPCEVGEK